MFLGLVVVLSLAVQGATGKVGIQSARDVLSHRHPNLPWHPVLRVDINCDGKLDQVFTARSRTKFFVAAVLAPFSSDSPVKTVAFRLAGTSQDSFCGEPSLIERERMSYDVIEMTGALPEGLQRSASCFGLRLVAGDCDSFHLFWNHEKGELGWWRL